MTGSQNMIWTYAPGKVMTYSKMMGCPSQTKDYPDPWGTGSPSPFYHYVKSRSYGLTQANAGDSYVVPYLNAPPGGVPNTGNRTVDYKNTAQFAFFGEPQVWNKNGGSHSPYWQTANEHVVIDDMAYKAVHIGKINNFCTLSGSVFMMTDVQMLKFSPVKTVKQYPFYAQ